MSVAELVEISQYYGKNPNYVIAGGGNTSFKERELLYVKASGMSLADAGPGDFVKMERQALARVWDKTYPEEPAQREAAVLADMMAARASGEEKKRPSVETLLHDILPFTYVVHTHPALVNGLTCAKQGKAAAEKLFANSSVWIPSTNPGYVLSKTVREAAAAYQAKTGRAPGIIFLQNHGIFVGADSVKSVKAVYKMVMDTILREVKRKPDFSGRRRVFKVPGLDSKELAERIAAIGKAATGASCFVRFDLAAETTRLTADAEAFKAVSKPFSPDHIVYAGSAPLFISVRAAAGNAALEDAFKKHAEKTGGFPKIAAVQGLGIFGIGVSEKAAANAVELFNDAAKIAVYAESFGGPRPMTADQTAFINNWEVERYRARQAR